MHKNAVIKVTVKITGSFEGFSQLGPANQQFYGKLTWRGFETGFRADRFLFVILIFSSCEAVENGELNSNPKNVFTHSSIEKFYLA